MTPLFIDPNIAKAKTIDTDFYIGANYYELSKKNICELMAICRLRRCYA